MSWSVIDNERAFARAERDWLTPPEYGDPKCECGNFPKYQIGNDYICEDCIDFFRESTFPENGEYCEYCGEDTNDGFRVRGEFYCTECFDRAFGI